MKLAIATLLFAAATAHANPRVAKSEAEKPCVAWVEDKCVARSDGESDDGVGDEHGKAAKPKVDAPAIVTGEKVAPKPVPAEPKKTAAIESISSGAGTSLLLPKSIIFPSSP